MDQSSPWYLKDVGNQVCEDPLENELRYTHKKLRHVHEMLQIKTAAHLNLMKESSILQETCAGLRQELHDARKNIQQQNITILNLQEEKLNYKSAGPSTAVSLKFAMEKIQELNDVIKDLKSQKETLKIYLAKVDNYSVRVDKENKSLKKQMERLKAIKQVDTQNERHRLDEWKSYVQTVDTKILKLGNADKRKQDEIENLNFMLREKSLELDNVRRLTKDTIATANDTRNEYIHQMKVKNTAVDEYIRKEAHLLDVIKGLEQKLNRESKKVKKSYASVYALEEDLLKSEKLVAKQERAMYAMQEELKLLVEKLGPKLNIQNPAKNKKKKNTLETHFCIKVFIDSDRIRIDDAYKSEVVHKLKQQLLRNDVSVETLWFPDGVNDDGYDSGEVVMLLSVKRARLEEDIHKLFVRLQKKDFPDVVMKTILPPIAIAWWQKSDL